jgi:putative methyltransferase (TIGR04325 family)
MIHRFLGHVAPMSLHSCWEILMPFKALTRQVLPPIVIMGIRKFRLWDEPSQEWAYRPEGWAGAPDPQQGWNAQSVRDTQLGKWDRFTTALEGTGPLAIEHEAPDLRGRDIAAHNTIMAYAYVLALTGANRQAITMLDWGGGIGHYCMLGRHLLPGVDIDYHCKDIPLLCEAGRRVVPDSHFYDDAGEALARQYDLVMASGSLQYSRPWREDVRGLAAATGGYLYITRLPIVRRAASFVVVQRPQRYGYGADYAGWFFNRDEFLAEVQQNGMELVREFLIGERPHVPGAPEQGEYFGYLFRPR